MNTDVWATVVAALGASLLTILGSFGLFQLQRWRDNRASARTSKEAAYNELHARAWSVLRRVGTLGLAKQFRSGIAEGLAVSMGQRKALDVFQLHDWLEADFRPLVDAYSRVCVVGSQEAIDIANSILLESGDLIRSATATDSEQSPLARYIKGERPTPEQVEAFEAAQKRLFRELEALVAVARCEVGNALVVLPLGRAEREAAMSIEVKDERDEIGRA